MALIVSSGLYIALRELRAARLEGAPTMVADTVTAPGAYAAGGSEEDGPG